jgi:hypothetical protein
MFTTNRRLTTTLMFAMLGAGCGLEETAGVAGGGEATQADAAGADADDTGTPTGNELAETLNACALPRPCSWPVSSGKPEETDSVRCVVAELAAGRALSVETVLVGDGAVDACETRQELHFFGDAGTAYYLWRKRCGDSEEHSLRRCDMLGHDAYASCLAAIDASGGGPGGVACSTPEDWVTACTEVERTTCS